LYIGIHGHLSVQDEDARSMRASKHRAYDRFAATHWQQGE
jgi:hypothetical protein